MRIKKCIILKKEKMSSYFLQILQEKVARIGRISNVFRIVRAQSA